MTPEQMLRVFHEAAGLTLPDRPTLDIGAEFVSDKVRQDMLDSEIIELLEAVAAGNLVGIADALADIVYVVVGTAVTYGLPFDAVLAEVHRSNMTKLIGGPVINEDGKIVKGPHYQPPQIAELLNIAVIDMGFMSLPADVQAAVDLPQGTSVHPTPDCGYVPHKPPGATECWYCAACQEFHSPTGGAK